MTLTTLLALPLPIGIFLFIRWRTAWQWRTLAERYGVEKAKARIEKQGWLVLWSDPICVNTYNGIIVAGISGDRLSLRIMQPFALFHKPLEIPFSELKIERSRWYLDDRSWMLKPLRTNKVGLIVPESYLEWIALNAGDRWPAGQLHMRRAATSLLATA